MPLEKSETIPVRTSDDVVRVRQAVRANAVAAGFGLIDQTKIITAASEIARNTVDYGGGGTLLIEILREGQRRGVRLTFTDQGPGIPDLARALTDGYTTAGGLGLGLSGAKRLSSEFDIEFRRAMVPRLPWQDGWLEAALAREGQPVAAMVGQTIRARGALDDRFGPKIEVVDPAMIEIARGADAFRRSEAPSMSGPPDNLGRRLASWRGQRVLIVLMAGLALGLTACASIDPPPAPAKLFPANGRF